MPNIKSAKKRVNVIKRQSNENIPTRGSMRTAVKKAVKDVENKSLLNDAVKKIDKAASKGVITKNTAAKKITSYEKSQFEVKNYFFFFIFNV